jgi:2-keto-4-pentenoate hydratase/2-oxohepta-3-ene-1,7-dioic acid hydratase in catechol pathway
MRLASYVEAGVEHPGVVVGDRLIDLGATAPGLPATTREILAGGAQALADIRAAVDAGIDSRPLSELTLGPCVRPQKFFGIGLNYFDHAREANREPTEFPTVFAKMVNCVAGPYDPVELPRVSDQLDYEAELALVIGTRCRNVSRDEAPSVVGGYTITNDFTIRDWQRKTQQWTLGKSFDTSGPLGPWLVTPDELPDPHQIAFRTLVNGELRQQSNTNNLIHDCWALIAEISTACTLEPGDVIATGTCAGVGAFRTPPAWLVSGDVVRVEFDGIGAIQNAVIRQPALVPSAA